MEQCSVQQYRYSTGAPLQIRILLLYINTYTRTTLTFYGNSIHQTTAVFNTQEETL